MAFILIIIKTSCYKKNEIAKSKKKPGHEDPASFNREASRLGDVGSTRKGDPHTQENPEGKRLCCNATKSMNPLYRVAAMHTIVK